MYSETKDQADKCIDVALDAMGAFDFAKGLRFLEKAKRLNPSDPRLSGYINLCEKRLNCTPEENAAYRPAPAPKAPVAAPVDIVAEQPKSPVDDSYTQDQLDAVNAALACKDFYQLLGVEKGDSTEVIKKAYKKQDKNHAPQSADVFKKILAAYGCLSDANKRKNYDVGGYDSALNQQYSSADNDEQDDDMSEFFTRYRGSRGGNPWSQFFDAAFLKEQWSVLQEEILVSEEELRVKREQERLEREQRKKIAAENEQKENARKEQARNQTVKESAKSKEEKQAAKEAEAKALRAAQKEAARQAQKDRDAARQQNNA